MKTKATFRSKSRAKKAQIFVLDPNVTALGQRPHPERPRRWATTAEAADYCHMHRSTLVRVAGHLRHGDKGAYRYDLNELDDLLAGGAGAAD